MTKYNAEYRGDLQNSRKWSNTRLNINERKLTAPLVAREKGVLVFQQEEQQTEATAALG